MLPFIRDAVKMLADYIVAESIEIPSTMNGIAATPVYKDCERQCPYYYYPICATNGNEMRMFVNACEMFAHNCDVEKSEYTQHADLYAVFFLDCIDICYINLCALEYVCLCMMIYIFLLY